MSNFNTDNFNLLGTMEAMRRHSSTMADDNEAIDVVLAMVKALRAFKDAAEFGETESDRMLVGMQMGCAYEMAKTALSRTGVWKSKPFKDATS